MKEKYRKTVGGYKLIADRALCDEDGNNIKNTKQNCNIADTTTIDAGMNLMVTTASGDIAKSNIQFDTSDSTRFLSKSGAWLSVVADSWKSFSERNGTTVASGGTAYYIGKQNSLGDKSIVFGNNNSDLGSAAVIGSQNQSSNTISSIIKQVDENGNMINVTVPTLSLIIGHNNESRRYNDIMVGYGNTSIASTSQQASVTDDDGFCISIGYRNIVERNYDIAIGHESKARGGENIALQHSTALGYRNFALFDSRVKGTLNFVSVTSELDVDMPETEETQTAGVEPPLMYCTKNFLHDSYAGSRPRSTHELQYSFNRNVFFGASVGTNSDVVEGNFISNGVGNLSNPCLLSYNCHSMTKNVIFDTAFHSVDLTGDFSRNVLIRNKDSNGYGIEIKQSTNVNENYFRHSKVDVTSMLSLSSNTAISSDISGTTTVMAKNFLCNSNVVLADDHKTASSSSFTQNFLVNSKVEFTNTDQHAISSGHWTPMKGNVAFGGILNDCYSCFVMSDYDGTSPSGNETTLYDCSRTVAFADYLNRAAQLNEVFAFGDFGASAPKYSLRNINVGRIFGSGNVVDAGDNLNHRYSCAGYTDVFGTNNVIGTGYEQNFVGLHHISVKGAHNKVIGNNITYTSVYGDMNKFQTILEVSLSAATIKQYQAAKKLIGRVKLDGTQYDLVYAPKSNGDLEILTFVSTMKYYFKDGVIAAYVDNYFTNAGLPVPTATSMTAEELATALDNESLPNGSFVNVTEGHATMSGENVYAGKLIFANKHYYIGYDGIVTDVSAYYTTNFNDTDYNRINSHMFVFGGYNVIGSNIVRSTIFGSNNKLSNTLVNPLTSDNPNWSLSNICILGDGNTATNGTNILAIGNGINVTGHNSAAIGVSLTAFDEQLVIGKYNNMVQGAGRVIPFFDTSTQYHVGDCVYNQDLSSYYEAIADNKGVWDASKWKNVPYPTYECDKALFVVGNGFLKSGQESSSSDWNNAANFVKSNALELYANGDLKIAGKITASNIPDIPAPPNANGDYMLKCNVNNGTVTYSWLAMNTTTV